MSGLDVSNMPAPRDRPQLTAIVCQGLVPSGAGGYRCGERFTGRGPAPILDQARAAGWRIGQRADGTPDAMCPDCGRPDPAMARLARDLGRSVRADPPSKEET